MHYGMERDKLAVAHLTRLGSGAAEIGCLAWVDMRDGGPLYLSSRYHCSTHDGWNVLARTMHMHLR